VTAARQIPIVCLANSWKHGGRCVAGKVWTYKDFGRWIRPVSDRPDESLTLSELQYEHGAEPMVLDVLDVSVLSAKPHGHQQENWLLDAKIRWTSQGSIAWDDLLSLVDPVQPLWVNGQHSKTGRNDMVRADEAMRLDHSLRLIHVDELRFSVSTETDPFGSEKKRVRGVFVHDGEAYALSVTDPIYHERFAANGDGDYAIGECCLTISLGERFEPTNACYKLIAAIMEPR